MRREDSRTNPPDARIAVSLARMHREAKERCSPQYARIAVRNARCLSSPPREKTFSAASALHLEERRETNIFSQNAGTVFRFLHFLVLFCFIVFLLLKFNDADAVNRLCFYINFFVILCVRMHENC